MFRENLLESSQQLRTRKRWPMAAAFAGEVVVAGLLIVIPLLTTGVISVSAHVVPIPLGDIRVAHQNNPHPDSGATGISRTDSPITLDNTNRPRRIGTSFPGAEECCDADQPPTIGGGDGASNLPFGGRVSPPVQPPASHVLKISSLSEAQLLKRVEPVYPRIAVLTQRQGDVKLHAFIGKDGAIESLSVISGDPLLASAALEAVRQWRYRPYVLNGEPVEVETFVTVSFKGIRN